MRDGLIALLSADANFEVIGHAADGMEGLRLCERLHPKLAIFDTTRLARTAIAASDQFALLKQATHLVCLTNSTSPPLVADTKPDENTCLQDNCTYHDLQEALLMSIQHQHSNNPSRELGPANAARNLPHPKKLSPKEQQVVQLIANGLSTKAIANLMGISFKTVATHRDHVKAKLGLNSIAELIRYAIQTGMSGP